MALPCPVGLRQRPIDEMPTDAPRLCIGRIPERLQNRQGRGHVLQQHRQRFVPLLHLRLQRLEAHLHRFEEAVLSFGKLIPYGGKVGLAQ